MILVVTIVGFLIHLFSIEHMAGEEGYHRFFAYMNLFVAFMLILVLADNFLLLYLGWEGVGLCSFLLIGFWYRDRGQRRRGAQGLHRDARRRRGPAPRHPADGGRPGQPRHRRGIAPRRGGMGAGIRHRQCLAAALILGGAVGKSAQLPLHTWLPDAMAGPSPVSALIHAATMVTAGVYLVARSNAFFSLAPQVLTAVAVIGAATLLFAGLSAARAARPQADPRLLDDEPDRLHVPRPRRRPRGRGRSSTSPPTPSSSPSSSSPRAR